MESNRFDALSRVVSSRRTALTGVLGGVATLLGLPELKDAIAHDPIPACQKINDPQKRRACLRRARKHTQQKHCKAQPLAVTCAGGRCGRRQNNCRRAVTCLCPADKTCLTSGTCGRFCDPEVRPCPPGCSCRPFELSDIVFQCYPDTITSCTQVPQRCTSTVQCLFGQFCGLVTCSPGVTEGRCYPVCPV